MLLSAGVGGCYRPLVARALGSCSRVGSLGMTPARNSSSARTRRNPRMEGPWQGSESLWPWRNSGATSGTPSLGGETEPSNTAPFSTGVNRKRRPNPTRRQWPYYGTVVWAGPRNVKKMDRIAPATPPFGLQGPCALAYHDDDQGGAHVQSARAPAAKFLVHKGPSFPNSRTFFPQICPHRVVLSGRFPDCCTEIFDNAGFFSVEN